MEPASSRALVSFSGISPGKDANDLKKQEERKEKKDKIHKKRKKQEIWEKLGPAESGKPGHSDWGRVVTRGGLQEVWEDVPDGVHPAEMEKKMAM